MKKDDDRDSIATHCYAVDSISVQECKPWILRKHYAKRMPMIQYAYGLFVDRKLSAVCTFGNGGGNQNNNSINGFDVIELNRLVATHLPKNGLSFFVSQCLRRLPTPVVVVSYADSHFGHVGYIYQATNWLYVGTSECKRCFTKDGREYHRKSIYDMGIHSVEEAEKNGFRYETGAPKHKYIFPIGSKIQKAKMIEGFDVKAYPKGTTAVFENSVSLEQQMTLF